MIRLGERLPQAEGEGNLGIREVADDLTRAPFAWRGLPVGSLRAPSPVRPASSCAVAAITVSGSRSPRYLA